MLQDKENSPRKDGFIFLPKELLKVGKDQKNVLVIEFQSSYDEDGQGLNSFIDVDDSQYLWSQGMFGYMNRIFPCFDQPNLKAKMNLTVSAPKSWTVISNENIKERNSSITKYTHFFKTTEILPVYNFVINAGPFEVVKGKDSNTSYGVNLYCRKSLHEHLEKDFNKKYIIESIQKSIVENEKLTGVDYLFSKADIVFVPEFPKNASPNPGAVTMNEKHLFKFKPDTEQLSLRHHILAYEIGHMWFGNLVTPKWWSDIWLHEAYNNFNAVLVTSKIFEKNALSYTTYDPWVLANSMRNQNAYNLDSVESSHPVMIDLTDTNSAVHAYDDLTYFKGSAIIKQLYFIVGEEKYTTGLQNYIQKRKFDNTCYECFLKEFKGYIDVDKFIREWFMSAGYNEISANWELESKDADAKIE